MELIKRYKWAIVGVVLAVLVVAFLAFRPDKLFVDDAVDESLADAFATTSTTVGEPAPTTTTQPATTTTEPDAGEAPPSDSTTTTVTSTTEASSPVVVASGDFYGIDHSAEGTSAVYEQDGTFVLRFEDDTDIQNGPDLFVWLLATDSYDGGSPGAYLDLGKIKGNVGGQNYELPSEYDPAIHRTVLVWCKRFSVPFAAAPLG